MPNQNRTAPNCVLVPLLLVSPDHEDRLSMERLLDDRRWASHPAKWSVVRQTRPEPAIAMLKKKRIPIVVSEADIQRDAWREMLEELQMWAEPPLLIVTSRLADDRLWAEALNRGAWDVLAKPLDGAELNRTLDSAWLHWSDRHQRLAKVLAKASEQQPFRSVEDRARLVLESVQSQRHASHQPAQWTAGS